MSKLVDKWELTELLSENLSEYEKEELSELLELCNSQVIEYYEINKKIKDDLVQDSIHLIFPIISRIYHNGIHDIDIHIVWQILTSVLLKYDIPHHVERALLEEVEVDICKECTDRYKKEFYE